MNITLSATFQLLDISPLESDIYLTLLSSGPLSITQLSKFIAKPRTTAHENIEKLIQKGLIVKTVQGSTKKLLAEPPTKLAVLLAEQKAKISHQQQTLSQVENTLPDFIKSLYQSAKEHKNSSDIQVKIVEGKKNVLNLYQEILPAKENYSFINLEKYYEIYPKTKSMFLNSYYTYNYKYVWDIAIDGPKAREIFSSFVPENRYHLKFIPPSNSFISFEYADYQIYDGNVALIQLESNNIQALVIKSQPVFSGFKDLHKMVWDLLPDPIIDKNNK